MPRASYLARAERAADDLAVLPPAEVEQVLFSLAAVLFQRAMDRGDIPRDAARRVNSAAQAVKGMRTRADSVAF
jgi:hypothetical protein